MALFNYATKEITLKIVYYGPGLSGKTTNLQHLHDSLNPETKGKLLSLSTESDRTLFFDFLPVHLGRIRDFSIRFQLYTVPGQVRYNATRKVVLKGADAVIFVADSQTEMKDQNIESLDNMYENLNANNINPDEISIILQYNKRDLKDILTIDELDSDLNPKGIYKTTVAEAINGTGVEETFKLITGMCLKDISRKHQMEVEPVREKEPPKEPRRFLKPAKPAPAVPEFVDSEALFEPESFETAEKIPEVKDMSEEETEEDVVPVYELEEETEEISEVKVQEELITEERISEDIMPEESSEEAVIEKKIDIFPEEKKERVVIREAKEIREVPVIPLEKINSIAGNLEKINSSAKNLEKINSIAENLEKVTVSIAEMKDSISAMGNLMVNLCRDIKEMKEIKREQRETNTLLQNIIEIFGKMKTKKSWFGF
jgi:mutual gliding-motility protein MglA